MRGDDRLGVLDRVLRASLMGGLGWKARVIAFFFSGVFLAGGVAVAWSGWVSPLAELVATQGWEAADGKVLSSELARSRSSDSGNSRKVEIRYEYHFRGRNYVGGRYDLGSSFTNVGVGRMEEIVEAHPVGRAVEVWVDPDAPEESVMVRGLSAQVWIAIPFCIPFVLIGVIGWTFAFLGGWMRRRSEALRSELAERIGGAIKEALLEKKLGEGRKFIFTDAENVLASGGLIFVSLFWNGIVSVFLLVDIQMILSGEGMALFLSLFLIPFVCVGGWLVRCTVGHLRKERPPGWVILAEKVILGSRGDEPGVVRISWEPLTKHPVVAFTRCSLVVIRGKENESFKKWKKKNVAWEDGLIEMPRGKAGEHGFTFEKVGHDGKWTNGSHDLHLVMKWRARDGTEQVDDWQLSPSRGD